MKISEVIEQLKGLQDKFGDLPVFLDTYPIGESNIDSINYTTDEEGNESVDLISF
jgi:hypothetical protein